MDPKSGEEFVHLIESLDEFSEVNNVELTDAIKTASSTDELVTNVRQAVTEEKADDEIDAQIRDASSLTDLADAIDTSTAQDAVEGDTKDDADNRFSLPVPKRAERAGAKTKGTLSSGKESVQTGTKRAKERLSATISSSSKKIDGGAEEVKQTIQNADPKESAEWGIGLAISLANPAIAASYSTAALLSGAVVSGSAIGAYSSSHEETIFDDINPLELAQQSRMGAIQGKQLDTKSGSTIGATIASAAYIAENATPEAYEQWVDEANVETVLEGAVMGVDRFNDSDDGFPAKGIGIGGGFGLLYSYTEGMEGGERLALEDVVDDDLMTEYRRQLDSE